MAADDQSLYALIQVAVEKGLRDMKVNLERGIRNLVDLGNQLASGRGSKAFFYSAKKELRDGGSGYYTVARMVVDSVNHAHLVRFGLNLGYNGLTRGVRRIREIEARDGYHIPWCVTHKLERQAPGDTNFFSAIVAQGRELGIYCHLVFADCAEGLQSLIAAMREAVDCAFFLFTRPECITDEIADDILRAKNIGTILSMDTPGLARGTELLRSHRCLSAGFAQSDGSEQQAEALYERAKANRLPFLFFLREPRSRPGRKIPPAGIRRTVAPVYLHRDILRIDRSISKSGGALTVRGDRSVLAEADGEPPREYLWGEHQSLGGLLREVMPTVS